LKFSRVAFICADAVQGYGGVKRSVGWKAPQPEQSSFSGAGDRLVHMVVTPPQNHCGKLRIKGVREAGEELFEKSLEPLPSLPTYLWSAPAKIPVRAFAIAIPDHLRVGYIAAENGRHPGKRSG